MTTFEEWRDRSIKLKFDVRPVIGGMRVTSRSEESVDRVSPADGKTLYSLPKGSLTDIDDAVRSCRATFEAGNWSDLPPMVRKAVLLGFAAAIEANSENLALFDCMEMGKPIGQAIGDAVAAAYIVRYYAEFIDKAYASSAPSAPSLVQYQRREPRGVVGAIVPWNYPLPNAALKIAPALAAGNCVVLKPSELSSSSALRLAELAVQSGVPAGAFNVVPGLGPVVGAALAAHKDVDFIAFTGSTSTGRALMREAGTSSLKPLQLECGGKSANIVFDDCADLAHVAQDAAGRIFANQGQLCVAGTRLVAHASIKDELVKKIVDGAKTLHIGHPLDPATTFGPLASQARMESVLAYCRDGVEAGAELRWGGRQSRQESGGFFVEPTIFDEVKGDMRIAQDDIFGPVLSVMSFETMDEAASLANSTVYGLSATVWTRDMSTAHHMIRRLNVGRVTVLAAPQDPGAFAFPMGAEPVRQSGFGAEAGREGFETYTKLKAVEIHV